MTKVTRTTPELIVAADRFALAQEDMAARAPEDVEHWHHVALAELLRDLAFALANKEQQEKIDKGKGEDNGPRL